MCAATGNNVNTVTLLSRANETKDERLKQCYQKWQNVGKPAVDCGEVNLPLDYPYEFNATNEKTGDYTFGERAFEIERALVAHLWRQTTAAGARRYSVADIKDRIRESAHDVAGLAADDALYSRGALNEALLIEKFDEQAM